MPNNETKEQVRQENLDRIARRSAEVVSGIGDNGAWKIVLEDMEAQRKGLDDNWQFVSDPAKLLEFRVTKMAVMKIINLVNDYKLVGESARAELEKIKNPEENIDKDVDDN